MSKYGVMWHFNKLFIYLLQIAQSYYESVYNGLKWGIKNFFIIFFIRQFRCWHWEWRKIWKILFDYFIWMRRQFSARVWLKYKIKGFLSKKRLLYLMNWIKLMKISNYTLREWEKKYSINNEKSRYVSLYNQIECQSKCSDHFESSFGIREEKKTCCFNMLFLNQRNYSPKNSWLGVIKFFWLGKL